MVAAKRKGEYESGIVRPTCGDIKLGKQQVGLWVALRVCACRAGGSPGGGPVCGSERHPGTAMCCQRDQPLLSTTLPLPPHLANP